MKTATRPDVMATVRLLSTEEGGRSSATPPEVFKCVFEFEGEGFDCALLLSEVGPLAPGDETTVPVAFLFPEYVKGRLQRGSRFRLWEGKHIAEGEILDVRDEVRK
jgi:hypothetical protein